MSQTINIIVESNTIIRILLLAFASFLLSMVITPIYTTLAYRRQWWKKPREQAISGERT